MIPTITLLPRTDWRPNGRTAAGRREIKAHVEKWFAMGIIRQPLTPPPLRRVTNKGWALEKVT